MKTEDATRLLDEALRHAVEESDIFAEALERVRQGGFSLDGIACSVFIHAVESEPVHPGQSDADFLRELHIDPNLTPGVIRSMASRRRRKRVARGR